MIVVKGYAAVDFYDGSIMYAVAFELLGSNNKRNLETWVASEKLFKVAQKATSKNRSDRYKSISEFYDEWIEAQ